MAIDINVPVATNQMAADLAAMLINTRMIVCGDGTAGRVLRLSQLKIEDGTTADTIKCTMSSVWNGDTIAAQDNIPYNGTVTGKYKYWFVQASNISYIQIDSSAFSGNIIAVPMITIYKCSVNVGGYNVMGRMMDSVDMGLYFFSNITGLPLPLHTNLGAGEEFTFNILYLTDA